MTLESHARSDSVDWPCVIERFDAVSDRTSVDACQDYDGEGGTAYHFRPNRRGLMIYAPSFGGPNGIFDGIVRRAPDGRAAVVECGGEQAWLDLD